MSHGLVIEITQTGREHLDKFIENIMILPNEIHMLSVLSQTRGGMHYPQYFEQFGYDNPSLDECREYLMKNGYTTEHE